VKLAEDEKTDLQEAIRFLKLKVRAEEVRAFATAALVFGFIFSVIFVLLLSAALGFSIFWLLFLAAAPVLYYYLKDYPVLLKRSEKEKVMNQVPEVMSYLIMSLRINPNIERAMKFAAEHSRGLFKQVFKKMMYEVHTGRYSAERGLANMADEWGPLCEEFRRAMRLVIASTSEKTETRRQVTLDNATDVLLTGLSKRTDNAARALHTPVMMVFTFGVVLPLVFVALIPFISLMGVSIGVRAIAIIYTVALPVFLYVLINFISSSRPLTISPPDIPKKEQPKFTALPLAVLAGGLMMAPGILYLYGFDFGLGNLAYMPFIWGFAASAGIYCYFSTKKIKDIRARIKAVENEFSETLYQLGVIMSEGRSFEDAMGRIKTITSESKSASFFQVAANNIRMFNTDIKSAFFNHKYGSLRKVYSDMIRGAVDTIIAVSDKGSNTIASVAFRLAEHINNMKKIDSEIEKALGSVVSSMKMVAMVIGPLVGGMISSMSVVLAKSMLTSSGGAAAIGFGGGAAAPIDPKAITLIIAIYAVESAIILTIFATDLIYGKDNVMRKYNVGISIVVAVFVFTICSWGSSAIFGGM